MPPSPTTTSGWPLPSQGVRVLLPHATVTELAANPAASGCHPTAFGYYPDARGHRMARTSHPDNLVIYCVSGSGQVEIRQSGFQVTGGDLLVLPAGVAHRYEASTADPWSIYWAHLDGDQVPALLAPLLKHGPVLPLGLHERLLSDFRALLALGESGYQLPALVHAASLCRGLLSYAALVHARRQQSDSDLDVDAVHLFMQRNLDRRLTLDELAAAAGHRSRYQFVRQYRARTGQTPIQAFLHRKIASACYVLEVTDLGVAEVAAQLGFEDPYYFSRLFRKIVGVSPTQYRRRGR